MERLSKVKARRQTEKQEIIDMNKPISMVAKNLQTKIFNDKKNKEDKANKR